MWDSKLIFVSQNIMSVMIDINVIFAAFKAVCNSSMSSSGDAEYDINASANAGEKQRMTDILWFIKNIFVVFGDKSVSSWKPYPYAVFVWFNRTQLLSV